MSGTELNIDDVLAIKMSEDGKKIMIERQHGMLDLHFYFESNKKAAQLRIFESFGRSMSVVIFNDDTVAISTPEETSSLPYV